MHPDKAAELVRESDSDTWTGARSQQVQRRVLDELREQRAPRHPAGRNRGSKTLWLGAAALVSLAALALVLFSVRPEQKQLQLSLADGSSVTALDETARVLPELISERRIELRQTSGSVAYDVAERPERTFVVRVDGARVEVLGTAFRIDRSDKAIRVSVLRGRVLVVHENSSASLAAGEEVTLATKARREAPPVEAAPVPPSEAPSAEASSAEAHGARAPEQGEREPPASSSAASVEPSPKLNEPPAAAELFRRADKARAAGDAPGALRHLRELVLLYPGDGRVSMARFTIGRLEASRGNHSAAADAFESCGSALGGEAIAEAALSRSAAGQSIQAKALAKRYSMLFPGGPRAGALTELGK